VGRVVALTAVIVAAVGCGSSSATRSSSTTTSPVWADLPAEVQVVDPAPLLPGSKLPAGATVTQVETIDGSRDISLDRTVIGGQQLYADPHAPAPADGRQLVVGRTNASDDVGDPADDGAPIAIHGKRGRIEQGKAPSSWIVSWPIVSDPDCPCDQFGFVGGIGLSRDQVVRAAEAAEPLASHPTVAASAIPIGLRSLGSLPLSEILGGNGRSSTAVTVIFDGVEVRISNFAGDARLAPHLRFWDDLRHEPWREVAEAHGESLVITYSGPELGILDERPDSSAIVGSLEPSTIAEAEDLARKVIERPPDDADRCSIGSGSDPVYLSGTIEDVRWVAGLTQDDQGTGMCLDTISADSGRGGGGGGGPAGPPAAPDEIRLVSGTGASSTNGLTYSAGHVPAGTARVDVQAGGRTGEVHLADKGPTPDRRWFIAIFGIIDGPLPGPVVAVAYDASGREIARTA
jgi:hypothetical protein